jgi:tRNA(Phe) wybutosine-synthesizing methylase Tyw3
MRRLISCAAWRLPCSAGDGRCFAEPLIGLKSAPNENWFATHRASILADLSESRNDRSLAGSIDQRIAPLVATINEHASYVTLSSCSGRISLFHRRQQQHGGLAGESMGKKVPKKRGSGLGTLFQSHDPFAEVDGDLSSETKGHQRLSDAVSKRVEAIVAALEEFSSQNGAVEEPGHQHGIHTEVLQLKFEPMILHVMCASLPDAYQLMINATESGQCRSGLLAFRPAERSRHGRRGKAGTVPLASDASGACETTGDVEASDCEDNDVSRKIVLSVSSTLYMDIPLLTRVTGPHAAGFSSAACEGSAAERALVRHAVLTSEMLFHENFRRTAAFMQRLQQAHRQPTS